MIASHTSSRNPDRHCRRLAIPLVLCLLAAGCGSASSTSTPTAATSRPTATTATPAALTNRERDTINKGADTFNAASRRGDSTGAALAATTEAAQITAIADAHRGTPLEGQLREMSDDLTAISTAITHHDQAALNQAEARLQQLTNSLGHT